MMTKKHERQHYAKVAALGCVACLELGYEDSPAEIHHIRDGVGWGKKSNFDEVIPLCAQHHRHGKDAIHQSKALFTKKFGTERELLEKVRESL